MTSLFTQVPLDLAIQVLNVKLHEEQSLIERTSIPVPQIVFLTDLCLHSTFFRFQGKFFEQTDGAAMGSPLSPIIANLVMEHIEEKAIASAPLQPSLWTRYVDDTFVIWNHEEEHLLQFHEHLNGQHPSIQFTIERESEGRMPFLDVLVSRTHDHLSTSNYRKPTHTDRYIPFHSNHHPRVLMGIARCMRNRALQVCDENSQQSELEHLERVFRANGFPEKVVMRALSSPCSNRTPGDWQQQEEEEAMKPLFVPYVRGLSERLEKVCTPLGVRPIFKPWNTLRRMLMQVKDRTPMGNKKEIVYEVPCHDCEMKYIGETKRSMKERVAEHRYAVKKEDVQKWHSSPCSKILPFH